MRDSLELSELLPLMKEVIEGGGVFRFYPRGVSMEPLIVQGKDSVELGKAEDIKIGDAVFYVRDNGQFVLHRIVGKYNGLYTMSGDHQSNLMEHGIRPEQILFKLVGYYKGEEHHDTDEEEYKEYVNKRLAGLPFYCRNPHIYKFSRIIKKILKKSLLY
ncbi:MAG: hypothetical protein IKU61_06085 [Clostridia bacterium]|nr:hypothetical protein [Clostridia bacterium]